MEDKRTALFLSIGMKQQNAVDVLKNEALTKALVDVIHEAGADNGCDPAFGTLLYTVANKLTAPNKNRSLVVQYVKDKKLKTVDQLSAAFKYLSSIGEQEVDKSKFESETGVGVEVTPALIHEAVAKLVAEKKAELLEKRYRFPVGQLIQSLKQSAVLKWADGKAVKDEVDKQVEALLGPRQDSDNQKAAKPEKVEKKAEAKPKEVVHLEKPTDAYAVIKLRALSSDLVGKKVEVNGWVHHLRVQKQAIFIELRDGTGFAQCVISGPAAKLDFVENLCRETSVQLLARVERPPEGKFAKWSGLELHVDWWKVWGPSDPSIEELVNQDSQPDQLFDQRHIVLRGERPATYLRLRSIILTKMRAHFEDRGYVEVTPPTICQTPCEGGSELFHVDYFGQDATMTQSSQLYLESVVPVVGDCFCIAPSYRAEKSRTRRHLAEYTHLEAERPFVTFHQLLNSIEDLVVDSMERLWATHKDLILSVNPKFTIPKRPFKRLRYGDAITFLKEHNIYKDEEKKIFYEFGEDIPEAPERKMIEMIGEPVFLTNFPVAIKAFYMPKDKDDPRLTESADLLVPGVGEIVGGSMRIWNYEELMAAYAREKIDPSPFYWFTDQRKFGSVPHGGYGLGVERFLVWVFGDDHIRNVCLYPRWVDRCKP